MSRGMARPVKNTTRSRSGRRWSSASKSTASSITALNGGPQFKFNEAISFQVMCESQAEVDYFWEKLSEGGDPKAQQCGWLKDKFGLSWQIIPTALIELMSGPDFETSQRA